MIKPMTKAQRAAYAKLQAARSAATDAVFVQGNPKNVVGARFSECAANAPAETVAAHRAACGALDEFERRMIAEGRGWRASIGGFYPY